MLAVLVAALSLAVWAAMGANRGWTKTTSTHMEKDPVTDIDFPVTEQRFSPGLEMLGGGFVLAAVLAVGSLFIPNNRT